MFKNDSMILELEERGTIQFGFTHHTQNELYVVVCRKITESSIFECKEFFVFLNEIFDRSKVIDSASKLEKLSTDKGDQFFIEAAVEMNATYLVTNDAQNGLLELGEYQGVKIVKPEKLIKQLIKVKS